MFRSILRFELAYHLKRPVTYLYFAVLFLLSFFYLSSEAVVVDAGLGLTRKNSAFSLTQLTIIITAIGQVITTALVGTSLIRDFQQQTHELLFTTRMSRLGYLGGRFAGATLVMLLVFCAIPLGALAGTFMPWVNPEKLLAVDPWNYFQPFLLFGVTNILFISALFFAVGALTRNMFAIYTQGIFLLVGWSVTQESLSGLDKDALSNALDPFGLASFGLTTRYWTVVEKNTRLLGLDGLVLTNRLIWLGVALALCVATFLLFRFEVGTRTLWRRSKAGGKQMSTVSAAAAHVPAVQPAFGQATTWRQLVSTIRFSFLRIVRDRPFLAIAAIGSIDAFMGSWYIDQLYDVTTWPVTFLVADVVTGSFLLYMIVLTTIYAGESVWRERSLRADQMADALPVSSWVTAAGKITGVILALTGLLVVFMLVGALVQTLKGHFDYQPALYLKFLIGTTLPWLITVTLFAFMVHALVNNKFVGHVVIILYWVGTAVASNLGLEHQLFHVGSRPAFTYSAMNGFGHFVANLALNAGYSLAVGFMLAVLAGLLWVRGTDVTRRARNAALSQRWTRRTALVSATVAGFIVLFAGAIFYNTNILNTYETRDGRIRQSAEWERNYRQFSHLTPPRIRDIDVGVELWPEQRAVELSGRYIAVNAAVMPIDSVFLQYDSELHVDTLAWSRPARAAIADTVNGSYLFVLAQPLAPGDTIELQYRFTYQARGFPNTSPNNRVVANGTFLPGVGPSLGYDDNNELSGEDDRRKQKLPARERLPDLDDPHARRNPQFSIDSDEIRFAATISTAPDQIALAPGYLEREWTEDGRRWFRYVMDRPIANFSTVVSARYAVRRDRWNDVDIEIYYHPGHEYNLDRMIEAVKASLDYFTTSFGPYQHRVVRILEFPRYAGFAQSFPATIPYSEGIGFILRVRDADDDLDMPFFVTAHEVAHQWWGHQVVGARAQGSALMVESMAEYAALTVMEKKYGPAHAQKFLRHELDRYLRGRAGELRKEQPLIRTENQAYIHYNKGALALYALRDYIGEDAMNRALRHYLQNHAHEAAPYSTARDFVRYLRQETPDSLQPVITDLFETITLFDNKLENATVTRRADGRYAVSLEVSARKLRADSVGNEQELPLADYIDVGVFGQAQKGNRLGTPLHLEKRRITEPRTTIEIVVDSLPQRAGIDPYNKLIDRVSTDNVKDLPRPTGTARAPTG